MKRIFLVFLLSFGLGMSFSMAGFTDPHTPGGIGSGTGTEKAERSSCGLFLMCYKICCSVGTESCTPKQCTSTRTGNPC